MHVRYYDETEDQRPPYYRGPGWYRSRGNFHGPFVQRRRALEYPLDAKPPVGLVPRHIRLENRHEEITWAIQRYQEVGTPVPGEWLDEYTDIERALHNTPSHVKMKAEEILRHYDEPSLLMDAAADVPQIKVEHPCCNQSNVADNKTEIGDRLTHEMGRLASFYDELCHLSHEYFLAKGFWKEDYAFLERCKEIGLSRKYALNLVVSQKLALIVSEVGEAVEGLRKNLMSDKCPGIHSIWEETFDLMQRLADLQGFLNDAPYLEEVQGADMRLSSPSESLLAKHDYNMGRPHKHGAEF